MTTTLPTANSVLPSMSLVVTCYNQERFIRESLKSVFAQDYQGLMQVVIVDDGSQDNSWAEIQRAVADFGQGWDVCFVRHERNMGVAAATDSGWSQARHEWIVGVDGDDVQLPDRCSKHAALIARYPEARLVTLSCLGMDACGKVWNNVITTYAIDAGSHVPDEFFISKHEDLFRNMVFPDRVTICCLGGGSAVHRSIFEKWGKLQSSPNEPVGAQDRIWSWRCILSAPACGSRAIGLYYRSHDHNLLNRRRSSGYRGYLESEHLGSRFFMIETLSLRTILKDLQRALNEPGLSIWTPEELRTAQQAAQRELMGFEMAAGWWEASWFERVRRAFHYRNRTQNAMKNWAWPRLLPCCAVAALRWALKK